MLKHLTIESHHILKNCRQAENIYIQDILSFNDKKITASISCPPCRKFPNNSLSEVTGGQLIDSLSQVAYCLVAFLIKENPHYIKINYDSFLSHINQHLVNFVRLNIDFLNPTLNHEKFTITCEIQKQPKLVRNVALFFLSFSSNQEINGESYKIIQGNGIGCCRIRN